jgi:hypothetical protein
MWKYYHPDHRENRTVRRNVEDNTTLYVYDGSQWFLRPIDLVITDMIESLCKIEWLEDKAFPTNTSS